MSDSAPRLAVGTVILAAGESARLGQPKQLLTYRGTPLLRHAVQTALPLRSGPIVIVLGAFAEAIRETVSDLPVRLIENPDWRSGMGTSIATGLAEILRTDPDLDGVLILLCDQPLVSTTALRSLIETYQTTQSPIVAAEYAGTLGVPAVFARSLFPELHTLTGKEGARAVIQKHRSEAIGVPLAEAEIDIDTKAEFSALADRESATGNT